MQFSVPEWCFSFEEVSQWATLWSFWMQKIVDHCLDANTVGGRTLSDVPLLGSSIVVRDVEAEILSTLGLRPLDIEDIYPVTPLQSGLLTAMLRDPSEYVLNSVVDIKGNFTFAQLKAAWTTLSLDTALLRTTFASTVHGLFQAVAKADWSEWTLSEEMWSASSVEESTKKFMRADRQRGFSLESRSFQRFTGFHVTDGRLRVIWTHHHALVDGWSLSLIVDKLLSICYGDEITTNIVPFRDHVEWLTQQDHEPSRQFWNTCLSNTEKVSLLALPKPQTPHATDQLKYKAISRSIQLPEMKNVCKSLGVTPSSVFRSIWAIILQQYSRSEYVMFGSVTSGRDTGLDGVDKIIGMLINTVPVQIHVSASESVANLIVAVHTLSTDLVQHSHHSLVDVKRWAKLSMETQLFDTILVYENYPPLEFDTSKPRPFSIELQGGEEFVDTTFSVAIIAEGDNFTFYITYNSLEVDATVADFVVERFMNVSLMSTSSTSRTVRSLDVPTDNENTLLQASCFGPEVPLPYELLHHSFEENARTNPDIRAIEYEDDWLSYGELNAQANTLAVELANMGVCVGSRVAVVIERCLEFPIGLLAALKVGAATMTLDATLPAKRISFILSDASAHVVLTTDKYRNTIECLELDIPVVYFSSHGLTLSSNNAFEPSLQHIATRDDEAYIVYTSGSTGKPKGVPVLHRGAVNVMMHMTMPGIRPSARAMQFMAIGFDGCQWEMWCTLSFGATLVLRSSNVFDTISKVETLIVPPTGLALLGHPDQYPNLKYIQVGGEKIPATLKDLWAPRVCLTNCYGPSECAVMTNTVQLRTDYAVTIGPPIPNVSTYILDDSQRLVPVGVVGEIFLGGICVSPCYINLPEQTAERFLENPFAPGQMYRTGDLGRMLPNGDF
ncbi:hypothetical protein As57867_016699, partial [Aphanomyces stellatus]